MDQKPYINYRPGKNDDYIYEVLRYFEHQPLLIQRVCDLNDIPEPNGAKDLCFLTSEGKFFLARYLALDDVRILFELPANKITLPNEGWVEYTE